MFIGPRTPQKIPQTDTAKVFSGPQRYIIDVVLVAASWR